MSPVATGAVHHVDITVSDLARCPVFHDGVLALIADVPDGRGAS